MNLQLRTVGLVLLVALSLVGAGCVSLPPPNAAVSTNATRPEGLSVIRSLTTGHVLEDRILALNPEHLDAADVATLAAGPTPRIFLLHGGVYGVQFFMESFARLLVELGYPESRIRNPATGEWSYSPYDYSERVAGMVAWHYEHDAMRPMLVGHSQGGLHAVKILKELAGQRSDHLYVWNPLTDTTENRTTITDPLTGKERPVIGTSVSYASAVGAGGLALVLPHQWESLATLRKIPDNVDEFTGYFISVDLIALTFPGNPLDTRYEGSGKNLVRNFILPASYNHVTVPDSDALTSDQVREWINAYFPGSTADTSALPADAQRHALWAADVWYSIKKHWCLEAQSLIRARRMVLGRPASQ